MTHRGKRAVENAAGTSPALCPCAPGEREGRPGARPVPAEAAETMALTAPRHWVVPNAPSSPVAPLGGLALTTPVLWPLRQWGPAGDG